MSFSYAAPTSGPSAGGIGWLDFQNLTLSPGESAIGLTGTLNDGTIVTFDISLSLVSGTGRPFVASTTPTFPGAQFGTAGYTAIAGNVAMYGTNQPLSGTSLFTINNIVVTNPDLTPVTNYTVVIADAERTNLEESWLWNTDGGNWNLLATLGANPPTLSGINTQTVSIIGNSSANASAYVATTQSPTQLLLTCVNGVLSRQAFAIGFATTRVRLQKNVVERINILDQFELSIGGVPSSTVTTSGTANGIQSEIANVFATPGVSYAINEAMAPGSVSALTDYTQVITAVNATPAGSLPPTGNLPINFTPLLGDDVTYTILNIAPAKFTKTVDKEYANIGEIITYNVLVDNFNDFAIENVLVTDPTPIGTTYVLNSVSVIGSTFTGTDPDSGIILTSIAANSSATVTWQIMVNSVPPIFTPIVNVAMVEIPDGISGSTNAVSTAVNVAYITVNKVADLEYAKAGDIITYTLTINNAGNVSADDVVITDAIPQGTTFVAGSVTGASGTPPTLTIPTIAAFSTVFVTFKVLVGNAIPQPNPIPNSTLVEYSYTVDPESPDVAQGSAQSNTTTTQVNMAIVGAVKKVNKSFADVGDVLTYEIELTNTGNVPATNVTIQDPTPSGTTFINGSLLGANGVPPTFTLANPIPVGGSAVVSYQVIVGNSIPNPNPILNTANVTFNFTLDPQFPDGGSGTITSNTVSTLVNSAIVSSVKSVDTTYANVGDIITYSITVTNSGSVTANNVVITDALPSGVTFVAGSLTNATGTPPILTLNNPIPAGNSVVVTFQAKVGNSVPNPNPIINSANVAFTYTVNPAQPNAKSGTSYSNTVETQINAAKLVVKKSVDKFVSYINDIITYQIAITNTGNVPANNVVITDPIPVGTVLVPGSMFVSVPYSALPGGAIGLNNPIQPGETVTITFKVLVVTIPIPNPIVNVADATYSYTIDPENPNGESVATASNPVRTLVFRNNYAQQISDLIESVALEQTALAAVINAEGAKIQRIAAMSDVDPSQLICLNKLVSDMMDSLSLLGEILKQKLKIVDCQIDGATC